MSELGSHKGEGNRYVMYLSAPAGGIAQMLRDPDGNWVPHEDYAQLKAEVERLKEGNECLDQMHEKEMARSAFLCEQVERLTKAVMHSPAAQLKLKELEGKTTYEEINPDNDYARLKAEVERLKQQVNYYAIEAKDFEDKWLTAIEVVTNLMKPRSEVGLVPPCIDKYEAK
jgi:hypothetical protein